MKRLVALASSAALVAGACLTLGLGLAAAPAGAAGTNLTIVQAATFNYPSATFTQTVCVDGTFVTNLAVGESTSISVTTGVNHTVGFVTGSDIDCAQVTQTGVVNVASGAHTTVGLIWDTQGRRVVEWPDETSCFPTGTSRITLRSGAALAGGVDLNGTVEGVRDVIISDVVPGDQATVEGPSGLTIATATITSSGNPNDVIASLGDIVPAANTDLQIYLAGGDDGSIGAFTIAVAGTPCSAPVSTTTTQAPAVEAVSVTPAFTG